MSDTYDVNEFSEVVRYNCGRLDMYSNREMTEFESQLIEEKKELEKENELLKEIKDCSRVDDIERIEELEGAIVYIKEHLEGWLPKAHKALLPWEKCVEVLEKGQQ